MLEELVSTIHLEIVLILAVGSALATFFGYITERMKLSPILGYLLAGYLIGPYSPGFVADTKLSEQLAEIGVILMMFWVGLHIKWQELLKVKGIAISGALAQTIFSTIIVTVILTSMAWTFEAAIVIGLSVGIASTVVLVRVLADNNLQNTKAGYISLSWLIFEDFMAVVALLLLPILASMGQGGEFLWQETLFSLLMVVIKFIIWVSVLFTIGRTIVSYVLKKINISHTRELFTLSLLAITFSITIGSAILTGTSIALGAFISGMLLGQTTLQQQISVNLVAIRDAFVVFFFLSIGMLFNPHSLMEHFAIFLSILAIVLLAKPLIALIILRLWKCEFRVSLTVAVALAQIGEFSFILVEEATKLDFLPDDGFDIIVACAFISLAINPLIVKIITNLFRKDEESLGFLP